MHISLVSLENFRSIEKLELRCQPGLTVVVGENNVGKSSTFAAISVALSRQVDTDDITRGMGTMQIQCELSLSDLEANVLLDGIRGSNVLSIDQSDKVRSRLGKAALRPTLHVRVDGGKRELAMQVGPIWLTEHALSGKPDSIGAEGSEQYAEFVSMLMAEDSIQKVLLRKKKFHITSVLQRCLFSLGFPSRFRVFQEFRGRPSVGAGRQQRGAMVESLDGAETVNVLFTLKNSQEPVLRRKFSSVQREFSSFFPGLRFEMFESPGKPGAADIQFFKGESDYPIRLDKSGAGIAQVLTLLTNLIAREDQILVIDTPEVHLHPHARRKLNSLIIHASSRNQVFVITHDVYFAFGAKEAGLVRVFQQDGSTTVRVLPPTLSLKERGQIATAMRHVSNREVVFARAVLLVEDESLRNFFRGVAATLAFDLDALGVSVIHVDGHSEFAPYTTLLNSLEIPCVYVRDLPWGPTQTPPVYWSWGSSRIEVEELLLNAGGGDLLEEAEKQVGKAKARKMAWVGENIPKDRIPSVFGDILTAVTTLAAPALSAPI